MQDTNLVGLIERFGSEDRCRAYLEELRWPSGPECPRCPVVTTVSRLVARNQFECDKCRYQFSVTAGTLFHDSHLPLWKWFLAAYLMCESKKGISAKQLQRMLKVSYKTAWYLSHRVRDAMGDDEQPLLTGTVELDETFVGGKRKSFGGGYRGNKVVIAGAIERGGEIRLRLVANTRRHNLEGFITSTVSGEAEGVYTDELKSYEGIAGKNHQTVQHKSEEWVRGEMEWRFNGRDNPYLFRDTLLILLHGDAQPYKLLIERDDPGEQQRENDRTHATRG